MTEETELKAPCGMVFTDAPSLGGHVKSCPLCQMLKGEGGGKKGVVRKRAAPKVAGEEEEKEKWEEGDDEEVEYTYPGPGPERLRAILLTNRYPKGEATRLARAFANNRWAWADWNQMLGFLVMHQVPHNVAVSVTTEYFGAPGPSMGVPGMFGSGGPSPPYGTPYGASYGVPQAYLVHPPAERPASDGTSAAAITAFGDITKQVLTLNTKEPDTKAVDQTLSQFAQRMEERVSTLQAMQEIREKFNDAIAGLKDSQLAQLQRQHDQLVDRLQDAEKRNPIQDFKLWRDTVEGAAKDMGYIPPGSQDIYGAMSNGFKELNETLRTGLNALFHKEPKDTGLEDRRKQAEVALAEDRMLQKALAAVRRASERKPTPEIAGEASQRDEGDKPSQEQAQQSPQRPFPRLTVVPRPGNIGHNELQVPKEEHEGHAGVPAGEGGERGYQARQPRPRRVRLAGKAG